MQVILECYEGCYEDVAFTTDVARGSDELTLGVPVACPNCGWTYTLTVDGDGEVDLESSDPDSMGSGGVIDDPDASHY
jgi:hypothetical protein